MNLKKQNTNSKVFPPSSYENLVRFERNNWWFRSRNNLLLWAMAKKVEKLDCFLEIGCGSGFVLERIHQSYPEAKLYGIELFEEGLAYACSRVPSAYFSNINALFINDSDYYNVIGAFDVLEHIQDDQRVLYNLQRALHEGGWLVITVPQHQWLWSIVDEYSGHVRRYRRKELVKKIEDAGMTVFYTTSFVSLLLPLMWISRFKKKANKFDPMDEFKIPKWLNKSLEAIMTVELFFLKIGVKLPIGGSLLLLAKKC
ncbi:MAG: SAM-dependent methyltransferase [Deltaproteobacteria bacterium]|nr:MAG: SAM-dependent methyltransferase [Deltaproteobacteria bacterium]